MQNITRNRIKLVLSLFPGIHLRGVQRALGISFSTTRYHVDRLSKNREIQRVEDGRYSRLYPIGVDPKKALTLSTLRDKTNRRILTMILQAKDGIRYDQLRQMTGLAKSTLYQHLIRLEQVGFLEFHRSNGHTVYRLSDDQLVQELLRGQRSALLNQAASRFVELWDF